MSEGPSDGSGAGRLGVFEDENRHSGTVRPPTTGLNHRGSRIAGTSGPIRRSTQGGLECGARDPDDPSGPLVGIEPPHSRPTPFGPSKAQELTRIPAWLLLAALAFTTSASSALPASATEEPINAATIEAMVECLVAELESRHDAVRHWEPENYPRNDDGSLASIAQPTGRTALVALALLEAGVPAQSPELSKALE